MPKSKLFLTPLLVSLTLPLSSLAFSASESALSQSGDTQAQLKQETFEEKVQSFQHNFPLAEQLSSNSLYEKRQKYLNDRGMILGDNEKDNGDLYYIGWGEASVKERPSSISYIDSKVVAFESALLAAKGEFASRKNSQVRSETVQKFFNDELNKPVNLQPSSSLKQLSQKIMALGNASLDKALSELDVDARQFTLKQKQVAALDSLQKTIAIKTFSEVAGVRTLATFEDNESVGVLIVYSEKLRQQASDIAQGKLIEKTKIIANHPSIQSQIQKMFPDDHGFVFQHGVRVLQDERGNPVLVSFAQSGARVSKNSSRTEIQMAVKAARSAAKSLSSSHIAEFVNATVNLEDKTSLMESDTKEWVTEAENITKESSLRTGKIIDNFIRQGASVKLSGITTLKVWMQNHPDTGHLIVGEVKAWSPYLSSLSSPARKIKTSLPVSSSSKTSQQQAKNRMRSSADFESDASF